MVFGPVNMLENTARPTSRLATAPTMAPAASADTDRRPLFQRGGGGLYSTGSPLNVSSAGNRRAVNPSSGVNGYWSGSSTADLRIISQLRSENLQLTNQVLYFKGANAILKARLDTSSTEALDLQQED